MSKLGAARSRFDAAQERLQRVDDEIAALNDRYVEQKFPQEARDEWNHLNAQRDELAELVKRERRAYMLRSVSNPGSTEQYKASGPAVQDVSEDPWTRRSAPLSDRAHAAVDALHRDGRIGDGGAELAQRLVTGDHPSKDLVRSWVLTVSSPHYESAFMKLVRNPQTGHRAFTAAEAESMERAMALDPTSAGGHLVVPFALDPTVVLASDGSIDPFREVCRRVTIANTDSWKGISSAGVVANWYPEAAEVTDDSPTLDDVEIPTHRASAWVPFSIELDQDSSNLQGELARLFTDAKVQLESAAFTTGSGSGEPVGIVTALGGSETVTTGVGAFVADDCYALVQGVPPRFRANMAVLANLAIIHEARRFTSDTEPAVVNDDLSRWLGKPLRETSTLDDVAATGDTIALAGDFSKCVIVDRVGMSVELNPMVMGANGRPTGQRGLFAHWRTGFDVLVPNAVRKLVVG